MTKLANLRMQCPDLDWDQTCIRDQTCNPVSRSVLGLQTPGLPKNGGCLLLPVLYINPACPRYVTAHALLCCVGVTCLILRPIPEYMKVYAPWACVCLAEFGDMCKGVITPPSHVRGFPPPHETVVGKTHAATRPAGDRRRRLASCVRLTKLAMPTHADSTHPTIQPLRYTTPPGTLWRIVRGAQRLHIFANTQHVCITRDGTAILEFRRLS